MTRTRIRLDTLGDVNAFVAVMSTVKDKVWLEDDEGSRVNAASLLAHFTVWNGNASTATVSLILRHN